MVSSRGLRVLESREEAMVGMKLLSRAHGRGSGPWANTGGPGLRGPLNNMGLNGVCVFQ